MWNKNKIVGLIKKKKIETKSIVVVQKRID